MGSVGSDETGVTEACFARTKGEELLAFDMNRSSDPEVLLLGETLKGRDLDLSKKEREKKK